MSEDCKCQPFVIVWKSLQEVDKEYHRCTRHFNRDPLEAKAACVGEFIVGIIWMTSKGFYVQTMFDNKIPGAKKAHEPDKISGPFDTEKAAQAWVECGWALEVQERYRGGPCNPAA